MTPEERALEWTNVNQVMELVKQEGDAACERAFDFLLAVRISDIAEEREACAKVAEQWPPDGLLPATSQQWFEDIAAAIRARP